MQGIIFLSLIIRIILTTMYLTGLIFNEHKQFIRNNVIVILCAIYIAQNKEKKVQVGKDQEKAQSEKDSHSKNRDGKKLN